MSLKVCNVNSMIKATAYQRIDGQIIIACLVSLTILIAGCSSPAPKPEVHTPQAKAKTEPKTFERSTPLKYSKGHQIVSIAESMLGSPYKYGGASPKGFDCSGLVYYTHQQLNITVPRTTRQQSTHRQGKLLSSAKPGDILFFRIYGDNISHAGIYAGNNQFIHAPKSGKYVSYANLNEPYWKKSDVTRYEPA